MKKKMRQMHECWHAWKRNRYFSKALNFQKRKLTSKVEEYKCQAKEHFLMPLLADFAMESDF